MNPRGAIALVLIVVLGFLAGAVPSGALFRLLGGSVSLVALSLLWLPWRRARLEVEREVPGHATAGEPVWVRYRITNRGLFRARNVWLCEVHADPRPTADQFARAQEPGGEMRNFFDRFFSVYTWNWLCETRRSFAPGPPGKSLHLRPGETGYFTTHLTPLRRGLVELNDLRAVLPDPLGLFQRSARVKASAATLHVWPVRHPTSVAELPGAAHFLPGDVAATHQAGSTGDFMSLREYRSGDPLRLIHWPGWARTGKPVVKELEDSFFPKHGLVLDTYAREGNEDLFEGAVSVAASFAVPAGNVVPLVEFLFLTGSGRLRRADFGGPHDFSLLEPLATVQCVPHSSLEKLRERLLQQADDLSGCLLVCCEWTPAHAALRADMQARGVALAAIVVCRERPETPTPGVYFVCASTLAEDLLQLPERLE